MRGSFSSLAAEVDALFPLTPTLSLAEREHARTVICNHSVCRFVPAHGLFDKQRSQTIERLRLLKKRRAILPLP